MEKQSKSAQKKPMCRQGDMFKHSEDSILAGRLMKTSIAPLIQGRFRSSEQYVNSEYVAGILTDEIGPRAVIEFCVTTLERVSANKKG